MVIQVGDSTAAVKQEISDLLEYVTGDGEITSWLNATNRINEVADLLGRDGIADGMAGATARARINALWDGPTWAPGATMALNWLDGRHFRGVPDLTRPTNATDDITGTLETYAPNVLRNPLGYGALLERAGTNLLTWSSDFSNAAWVKVESSIIADGAVYRFVPSTAAAAHYMTRLLSVASAGVVGRVRVKADTDVNKVTLYPASGGTFAHFNLETLTATTEVNVISATINEVGGGWYDLIAVWPDSFSSNLFRVYASSGTRGSDVIPGDGTSGILIARAQVETGPVATSYIPTEGATASRAADMLTVPVQDGGRAFAFEFDYLGVVGASPSFQSLLVYNNGVTVVGPDRAQQAVALTTLGHLVIGTQVQAGGSSPQISAGLLPGGRNVIYGIAGPSYRNIGRVGVPDPAGNFDSISMPGVIDRLGVANNAVNTSSNTNIRARRFMEILNPPDPEAAFAQVRAIAQEWAA